MLSAGTHSSFSSNWKPALVTSNRAHRSSEITKVTSEVTSAALLQLRSTASLGPFTTRQNSAPTKGRNFTSDRIGQLDIATLPRRQHEVGHEAGDADQHREGIVIEVAALETHQHARHVLGARGDIIGTQPVDGRFVTLLPEHAADRERGLHEQHVVKLVEVPLVEEEGVDA